MIEGVLQPDTSNIYSMHETRFFDDEEKKQLYDLYRTLMDLNRQSIAASLEQANEAKFINSFFNKWKDIKEELLVCVGKMKDSWKAETDIEEDVGYLG